jgi:LemA protein
MALWIVIIAAVLILLWAIVAYNHLIAKRNRVRNAWAQIDVQLKRRHDLIPNLVNTVKGYMQHERGVLESVTQARAQAIAAGNDVAARAAAENDLTRAVRSLFAVAESYPDLKADRNALALQEELASTENKIAFARQFYNDAVMDFNTARETFPASLIANAFGFQPAASFELTGEEERAVPEVKF